MSSGRVMVNRNTGILLPDGRFVAATPIIPSTFATPLTTQNSS